MRLGDGETESSTDAAGTHSTTNAPTMHSPLARDVGADGAGAGIAGAAAAADSAMLPVELSDVARGAAAAEPSMEAGGGQLSEEEAAVALAVIQRDAKEQIQVRVVHSGRTFACMDRERARASERERMPRTHARARMHASTWYGYSLMVLVLTFAC